MQHRGAPAVFPPLAIRGVENSISGFVVIPWVPKAMAQGFCKIAEVQRPNRVSDSLVGRCVIIEQ